MDQTSRLVWLGSGKNQEHYRNFRPYTRTADYPQWSIFVITGKKVRQITRTGLLPAPQNKRKSCYRIIGMRTHKLGAMSIPCFCYKAEDQSHFLLRVILAVNNAALNTPLSHFWFVLLKRRKINIQCVNAKTR